MDTCKIPCRECPFLKASLNGYLGTLSGQPDAFLKGLDWKGMPCHLTVDWNTNDFSRAMICKGSLQYQKNTFKIPFDKEHAQLVEQQEYSPDIFETKEDFLNHHTLEK